MARLVMLNSFRRFALMLALAIAIVSAFGVDFASACPTCKDGVAQNDPHHQAMAAGYYYSILFMMSMPFIILTTFGSFAYRAVKKAEAQRNAAAESPVGETLTT